jgi:DNA-directed RNA polymerase subunit F
MDDSIALIAAYERGPIDLSLAVAGMSPDEIDFRPSENVWSTREIICHLADFELINAERIKRVIAEDQPTLFNAEPEPFAATLAYSAREFEQELVLIASLRRHIATILRELKPEHWNRTGNHSVDGPLTLAQLVNRVTIHIPHHIRFIDARKAVVRKGSRS